MAGQHGLILRVVESSSVISSSSLFVFGMETHHFEMKMIKAFHL